MTEQGDLFIHTSQCQLTKENDGAFHVGRGLGSSLQCCLPPSSSSLAEKSYTCSVARGLDTHLHSTLAERHAFEWAGCIIPKWQGNKGVWRQRQQKKSCSSSYVLRHCSDALYGLEKISSFQASNTCDEDQKAHPYPFNPTNIPTPFSSPLT